MAANVMARPRMGSPPRAWPKPRVIMEITNITMIDIMIVPRARRTIDAVFVQATALANGLFQVFGAVDLAMVDVADFQAVAVGSQVHSGEAGTVLHECLLVAGVSIAFTAGATGGPGTGFSQ